MPAPVPLLAAIVLVMAAIMWTYDGWSDAGRDRGEVKNPGADAAAGVHHRDVERDRAICTGERGVPVAHPAD